MLSIVIPAYNEAKALPLTLQSLHYAIELIPDTVTQIIVVDNASTDRTPHVAKQWGCEVVHEELPSIGAARNRGAAVSSGKTLLFLDADVIVSRYALLIMLENISRDNLELGGLRAIYQPNKLSSWLICAYWDWRRNKGGPPQGVAQFVSRSLFQETGGYNPDLSMSEDIDFYIRATLKLQERNGVPSRIIQDAVIWPSCRRYDQWSTMKMLFYQNPITASCALRSKRFWKTWRESTIR